MMLVKTMMIVQTILVALIGLLESALSEHPNPEDSSDEGQPS